MKENFGRYHPILNFIFYMFVIGTAIFSTNPVILGVSFAAAITYVFILKGVKSGLKSLFCFALPVMIIVSLFNTLFNHYGVTTLMYMWDGNPITLESMVYGFVMALMLATVIMWFSSYNIIMTSDKFIYIFGRIIPGLSLILSMALRFVPRFIKQGKKIGNSRKAINKSTESGNILERIKNAITNCSILITWALENSIETADSMKARGYGTKKRTNYAIFILEKKDITLAILMTLTGGIALWGLLSGEMKAVYNPVINLGRWTSFSYITVISFGAVCFLPVFLYLAEIVRTAGMKKRTENRSLHRNTTGKGNWRLWEL